MAYVTKPTARISRISLISNPLPLQECSHVLLHYACQSESSTEKLFNNSKLTRKIDLKGRGRRKRETFKYEGFFQNQRLADFAGFPDESLEHIASQPLIGACEPVLCRQALSIATAPDCADAASFAAAIRTRRGLAAGDCVVKESAGEPRAARAHARSLRPSGAETSSGC